LNRRLTADAVLATLDNGIRVVVVPMPHVATASVSVFVRSGSQHETRRENGISHVIEHMAFKGTRTRTCQQINLDAERLGADVNAHTDKDHTAFHMRGNARDAPAVVGMLGDIVQHGIFPEDELERERDVLLQEYTENEDDPMSTAFKLFDRACYGRHAAAQPVIGTRANISRFAPADLAALVGARHTGANTVVGVAGCVDAERIVAAARTAFAGMPRGEENRIEAPAFIGGVRTRRVPGDHVHVVLGFPAPSMAAEHEAFRVAAALFGEGMSSPLLDALRERRGLVYHADCSTDLRDAYGQFVIEASTMPRNLAAVMDEIFGLLRRQATRIDAVDLERARNQLAVRTLYSQEAPDTRLELAALDLFALGRMRTLEERLAALATVTRNQVRDTFAGLLAGSAAVAMAGKVSRRVVEDIARQAPAGSLAG
jgi:predicted Zn-dependent peptidase